MLRSKHQRSPTVIGMLLEMRWIGSFPMSDLAIGGGRYGYWLEKRGHWLLVSKALVHPVHPVLYQTTKIPGLAISSHTRHDGTMADPRYPAKTNCAYICTVYIKYNTYIYICIINIFHAVPKVPFPELKHLPKSFPIRNWHRYLLNRNPLDSTIHKVSWIGESSRWPPCSGTVEWLAMWFYPSFSGKAVGRAGTVPFPSHHH